MTELTQAEKTYNDWWMSRFDSEYKTICLYNRGRKVQTYTTANRRYSDEEDARLGFQTAQMFGLRVTSVTVDGTEFKKINGKVRRVK